jgi:hypothetical protein
MLQMPNHPTNHYHLDTQGAEGALLRNAAIIAAYAAEVPNTSYFDLAHATWRTGNEAVKKRTTPSLAPCDFETLNKSQRGIAMDPIVKRTRKIVERIATRSRL